jgi:hypothetical protein
MPDIWQANAAQTMVEYMTQDFRFHASHEIEGKRGDTKRGWLDLLVCQEDLEGRNEVSKRNALVALPLLVGLNIINEDDEVVAALVVDLSLLSLATSHCDCLLSKGSGSGCIGDEESSND